MEECCTTLWFPIFVTYHDIYCLVIVKVMMKCCISIDLDFLVFIKNTGKLLQCIVQVGR